MRATLGSGTTCSSFAHPVPEEGSVAAPVNTASSQNCKKVMSETASPNPTPQPMHTDYLEVHGQSQVQLFV